MGERFSPRNMELSKNKPMVRGLHKPVLLQEVMHFLNPAPGKVIIDATIGGAGHAAKIMQMIGAAGTLIGIDRDSESLNIAHERLKSLKGTFKLVNRNFKDIREIVQDLEIGEVDGVLFDLGISSIQIETRDRGFSIKNTGPLDMRMDRNARLTASELVNSLREDELSDLIRDFGEERFHRRIAREIVSARRKAKIETTSELAEVVSRGMPHRFRRQRIHPATRTFQAFRIRVNGELEAIEEALRDTPPLLKKGGRVCIISFHSLEDRIAKNTLKEFKARGVFKVLTKKPVVAEEKEVLENPRARSAKLRAAERIT